MLRVTLEQWRMFKAVVEHGGFNQAGQLIHKSQSSIHSAVSKIEESLGVKLFDVQGRKTVLTEAGQLLYRRALYLLDEAERIESVGYKLADGIETKIRIAVDEIFPQPKLYQVLDQVSKQFPMLNIELEEEVLTGASERLANGEVDLAISPLFHSHTMADPLVELEFVAVAHPEHPLHQLQRVITLEDLKSHRQIVVRDSATANRRDSGWLGADQRWTVSHVKTSIDMISRGLGYAWLPTNMIVEQLAQGRLQRLNLQSGQTRQATLFLLVKDSDCKGPAVTMLIEELRKVCLAENCAETKAS